MLSTSSSLFNNNKTPYAIYALGLCFLVFLAMSVQPDVFFSGDGGMKFMIVQQINAGQGFKYMHLPQPQWVHDIWNSNYFPFNIPFVYPSPQGLLYSFPPYFQIISAFLYGKMGYMGLYLIPLLSTATLWIWLIALLQRYGVEPYKVSLAAVIFIFCSPLTLYGVTYWEHMPAVLFLFSGIAFIMMPARGLVWAIIMGCLSGFAVWFRPEALLMNLLYVIALIVLYRKQRSSMYLLFIAGVGLLVAGFFVFNELQYGHLLGIHGNQVLEDNTLLRKFLKGGKNVLMVNWLSIQSFPFILLLIPVIYQFKKHKWKLDLQTQLLVSIIVVYCALSPFVLPNRGGMQWGARYFLPLIPLVIVVLVMISEQWELQIKEKQGKWMLPAFALLLVYCLFFNTYLGGMQKLRAANYYRVKPALNLVKEQDTKVIVVSSGYIPMEMASLFDSRYFFLAENTARIDSLMPLLKKQGVKDFMYVNEKDITPGLPNLLNASSPGLIKKGTYFLAKYQVK